MHWLSQRAGDIDWGNAPSWAAVCVAAVVGSFTVRGIRIASRQYEKSVWDTKVAQARLVWGEATGRKQRPIAVSPDMQRLETLLTVKVTNNSKEPVGGVMVRLLDAEPDSSLNNSRVYFEAIAPESSVEDEILLPNDLTVAPSEVTVRFSDSAGHNWERDGIDPPRLRGR